jgi:site-specific DNA recombinase
MRAAVYLRQSKDQHGTGLAVARQREDCLELCTDRGWEPVEYIDNDVSAFSGKRRPAYQRMLDDIEAGDVSAVVAWDLDRLHRRPIELEHFIEVADRHRVALATVSGDTDLGTDSGRLFARVKGAVARSEGERKSARQKRAALQAAELGRPRGGPRAFGYEPDGLTIRTNEAKALRDAYDALLAGGTLTGISRLLNGAGLLTPQGRPFRHNAARVILQNPRNAGLRAYRGEIVGSAVWPAIVPEETWRAADALLSDPSRRTNNGTARRWLLGGLALCGRCDDGVTTVRVNYRERDAAGQPVRVYRCRASAHLSREASFCDWRVSERVIARLSRVDARDLLVDDERPDISALRSEADALRLRLGQIAEAFGDGAISAAQLRAGSERLKAHLGEVEAQMVHVDRGPLLADLVTAGDVRSAWEAAGLDRQRAIIPLLYTVTLLPRSPGRAPVEVGSVRMEPRV